MKVRFARGTEALKQTRAEFKVHQIWEQQVPLPCIIYHNGTSPASSSTALQAAGRAAEQVAS